MNAKPIREQSAMELLQTHADALTATNEALRAGLLKSVEVIQTWHNMGLGNKASEIWDIYWRKAPEMKPIREALSLGAEQSHKGE